MLVEVNVKLEPTRVLWLKVNVSALSHIILVDGVGI